MTPIVALIIRKILDYLADHADEIIEAIKEQFLSAKEDPGVKAAIQEFGYAPTEDNLTKLSECLEAKGEDTAKLASILVTKTIV